MKKRLLALTMTAVFTISTTAFGAENIQSFTDYNTDLGYGQLSKHWAKSNIETLLSHNGINGYQEGDFRANKEISAAELIAIILNVTDNADDLTGEAWAEKILTRAYELGICKETEISVAEGNQPISREKMALVLVNSAEKLNNEDTTSLKLVDSTTIYDLSTAHAFYQNAIVKAYSMGLLAGTGLNYNPKASTTRAEATAIVNRLMGYTDRVDAEKAEADRIAEKARQEEAAQKAAEEIDNKYPSASEVANQIINGESENESIEWDPNFWASSENGGGGLKLTPIEETGASGIMDAESLRALGFTFGGSGSSGGSNKMVYQGGGITQGNKIPLKSANK